MRLLPVLVRVHVRRASAQQLQVQLQQIIWFTC